MVTMVRSFVDGGSMDVEEDLKFWKPRPTPGG